MARKMIILIVFVMIILIPGLFLPGPGFSAPQFLDLEIEPVDEHTSNVQLYFEGVPPFTIYRSLDGQSWGAPLVTALELETYLDEGLTNHVNYYYRLVDASMVSDVQIVFPPNRDVHGRYARNTDLCAMCHIAHAAMGARLLIRDSVVATCTSCHDGTQSKYDVRNGQVNLGLSYAPSNAGPFGALLTDSGFPWLDVEEGFAYDGSEPVNEVATSIHRLGAAISSAPGTVSDRMGGLGCQDCHNPHGSSNYRNLRTTIPVTAELASENITVMAFSVTDPGLSRGYGERIYYLSGSSYFCSSCHSDFHQTSGSGSIAAAESAQGPEFNVSPGASGKYMHSVNTQMVFDGRYFTTSLPMETGSGVNQLTCLTCHFAHGTNKTGLSIRTNSTALLRLDDQAVCQDCHKR